MPVVHDQLQICFLEAVHSYYHNMLGAITCVMPAIVDKEVPVNLDDILRQSRLCHRFVRNYLARRAGDFLSARAFSKTHS